MGEGRQRYADYCIKIFEYSTEEEKRGKKLILTNRGLWELQVRLSSIYWFDPELLPCALRS